MRKRPCLWLLPALLAALLLGCGGEHHPAPSPSAAPSYSPTPSPAGSAEPDDGREVVTLYTSLREDVLTAIKEGFEEKYPQYVLETYNAASDTVIDKIYAEAALEKLEPDVIWVGDTGTYEYFKRLDILRKYISRDAKDAVDESFRDPDGYFTAGRLATMGIAVNTSQVGLDEAPKTWNELLDEKWKEDLAIADPAISPTSEYWTCALMCREEYGTYYIRRLCRNGCGLESGAASLLRKIQSGEYALGVCPDYLAQELMRESAPIAFIYPEESVVVETPLSLVKDSANPAGGRRLYDYILSKEGQQLLVDNGLVSVRDDVEQSADLSEIVEKAMVNNDEKLAADSEKNLKAFDRFWREEND